MKIKNILFFALLILQVLTSVYAAPITAGDYSEFLNAVVPSDPHGFYAENRLEAGGYRLEKQNGNKTSCNLIVRSGKPGHYSYAVGEEKAHEAVNYVSCWEVSCYYEWLENGASTSDFSCCEATDRCFTACDSYLKSNLLDLWNASETEAPSAKQEGLSITSIVERSMAVLGIMATAYYLDPTCSSCRRDSSMLRSGKEAAQRYQQDLASAQLLLVKQEEERVIEEKKLEISQPAETEHFLFGRNQQEQLTALLPRIQKQETRIHADLLSQSIERMITIASVNSQQALIQLENLRKKRADEKVASLTLRAKNKAEAIALFQGEAQMILRKEEELRARLFQSPSLTGTSFISPVRYNETPNSSAFSSVDRSTVGNRTPLRREVQVTSSINPENQDDFYYKRNVQASLQFLNNPKTTDVSFKREQALIIQDILAGANIPSTSTSGEVSSQRQLRNNLEQSREECFQGSEKLKQKALSLQHQASINKGDVEMRDLDDLLGTVVSMDKKLNSLEKREQPLLMGRSEVIAAEKAKIQQDINQLRTTVLAEEEEARNAGIIPAIQQWGQGWFNWWNSKPPTEE